MKGTRRKGATGVGGGPLDAAPPARASDDTKRTLIFHYHLFKNAGTSIDEMLRLNFGARWVTQEFPPKRRENAAAVADFIRDNSGVRAISSHTAFLPVPRIAGLKIFPILFIRHPIDRLRSAYEFERKQNAHTAGARLAKMHDFAGYLRELLRNPHHRQARNFQTFRLSQNEPPQRGSERERAMRTLEQLPFVGLVEDYDRSVERLRELLQPAWPRFVISTAHRNLSRAPQTHLAERLTSIEKHIGPELYARIHEANLDDLSLYLKLEHLSGDARRLSRADDEIPGTRARAGS